jgi:hypothetical protein
VELQIPYCVGTKISQKDHIWAVPAGNRKNTPKIVRVQRNRNSRSKCMCRPHTYVREDSTQIQRSTDNGISQGKEFANAV